MREGQVKIKLSDSVLPMLLNRGLNKSVLRQAPFFFNPESFTSSVPGLKVKAISKQRQTQWFNAIVEEPLAPRNICIVSAPNDGQAKLLAAYFMQISLSHCDSKTYLPLWCDINQGFKNELIDDSPACSMLFLNNVGAESSPQKIEKLRDTLEHYSDKACVVVATGCDPFEFFTRKLYLPINACFYLTTSMVNKKGVSL